MDAHLAALEMRDIPISKNELTFRLKKAKKEYQDRLREMVKEFETVEAELKQLKGFRHIYKTPGLAGCKSETEKYYNSLAEKITCFMDDAENTDYGQLATYIRVKGKSIGFTDDEIGLYGRIEKEI